MVSGNLFSECHSCLYLSFPRKRESRRQQQYGSRIKSGMTKYETQELYVGTGARVALGDAVGDGVIEGIGVPPRVGVGVSGGT